MSDSLAIIPRDDEELHSMLPARERAALDLILDNLPFILAAKSTVAACRDVAPRINLTERQLYRRICDYLDKRDWKCLVNKARAGAAFWQSTKLIGLPVKLQKFYQGLCEKHQRTDRGGYLELMRIWKTHHDAEGRRHDHIPGYEAWPRAGLCGHPAGWSERNLSRYAPDYYDSAAARTGAFAASMFRPSVRKTRTSLAFGEQVQFDDHEYNLKLHLPGQVKVLRPRGFGAAECLTTWIKPVFKMTLWDEEEEKKKTLREIDFQWFALYWLSTIGYRTDAAGTMLLGERGLSVFREEFAARLWRACDEKVFCPMPGAVNDRAHKGQFAATGGKSNFRRKPLIEGAWAKVDNYFDRLPGQVGLNRLTAPEEMSGREHYLQRILKAAATQPAERAKLLKIPFMTWAEFMRPALDIYREINALTEHEIEGWTDLGFHVTEWRINEDQPWQPRQILLALPEPQREAMLAVLDLPSKFPLTRARNLSPDEVFHVKHAEALERGEMAKLSIRKWAHVMGLKAGHPVTVNKESKFVVKAREFGPSGVEYLASINGQHLPVGGNYLAFINPWWMETMLLCKPDGAAVGLCELWDRPGMNDQEGIKRMAGKQAHWEAQRRHGLNERHADRAAEITHMEEHNAAVMSKKALAGTPEAELERMVAKADPVKDQLSRAAAATAPAPVTEEWDS